MFVCLFVCVWACACVGVCVWAWGGGGCVCVYKFVSMQTLLIAVTFPCPLLSFHGVLHE